jgi:hypothetical protein
MVRPPVAFDDVGYGLEDSMQQQPLRRRCWRPLGRGLQRPKHLAAGTAAAAVVAAAHFVTSFIDELR